MGGNKQSFIRIFALGIFTLGLSACGGGSSEEENNDSSIVIDGTTPIAYVKRSVNSVGNPTDAFRFNQGGDLYMRQLASASSTEKNLTGHLTNGQGDVSDPEVSYDGKRILFSMKKNSSDTWNIYEFDTAQPTSSSNPKRIISSDSEAAAGDDVDPNYLADDRIIFSSNRQVGSKAIMTSNGIEPYTYRDEYEREHVITLHVMDADGSNIHQITFNQSHDRNPTVLSTGEVMFAHWDHVGGRNEFSIFTANPDGTNMFVLYGAHSPGNSFLHPREIQNGDLISTLMPLSRTFEGGALMQIRVTQCSEDNDCNDSGNGQSQATTTPVNFGQGLSANGRFTTPYPLWDNTNRVLVSYTVSCVKFNTCPTQTNPITGQVSTVEGTPQYGIYMLNIDTQQLNPLILAPAGISYTDPVALLARPRPNVIPDKTQTGTTGILNVKSVYDTDNLGRMSDAVLTAAEQAAGIIPKTAAPPGSNQSQVADIATLKNPANAEYKTRPARFVRIVKAVPTPSNMSTEDIGETMFEMQQIVGYTEIEPDGSFKIEVPADTPLAISVIDSEGRAFHPHTNWIQVRPGETRTCNGCHSPRRGSAINAQPIAGAHPNTNWPSGSAAGTGETMAETRVNNALIIASQLQTNMVHTDIWADAVQVAANNYTPNLTIDYLGLPSSVTAPVGGIINYPDHIAPLWTASRTYGGSTAVTAGDFTLNPTDTYTCTSCHNANAVSTDPAFARSAGLDLRDTKSGTGRLLSYNELLIGDVIIDQATGLPVITLNVDEFEIERYPALVNVSRARSSYITEVLTNSELNAADFSSTFNGVTYTKTQTVSGNVVDHSTMLNASEKRVIYEWIDLGGQYYNDPFESDAGDLASAGGTTKMQSELRNPVSGLSQSTFDSTIHPILMNRCASCHQPASGNAANSNPTNPVFTGSANRFVLTGQMDGDFNITTTMVTDLANPASSNLLTRPTSIDPLVHPQVNSASVLSITDSDYTVILNWITAAGP